MDAGIVVEGTRITECGRQYQMGNGEVGRSPRSDGGRIGRE